DRMDPPAGDPNDPHEIARRLSALDQRIRRRSLLGGALGVAGLAALGLQAPGAAARPARQDASLPDDAAPPDEQVFVLPNDPTTDKTPDFYESVYQRISQSCFDILSDPLVRLSRDIEIIPAAATEWNASDDGKTWTFKLDPNLMWNDGTPVTAADYIATFQYGADPKHAWDFTWFYQGILQGWDDAIAGKIPLDKLGVHPGADEHELVFETVNPAPYLPAMLLYSPTLQAAALKKNGSGLYNADPATSVSAGPFKITEWTLDQRVVYEKNPDYKGTLQVPVNKVVVKLADPKTWFTMYQNDEIDYMQYPAPADIQVAQQSFPDQVYSGVGDFRTYYIFFDVTKAPFDKLEVRQAFSHAIDRDAIKEKILGPAGVPAYSWLAPGFPAANGQALKGIQNFDPAAAKKALADAGFADGQGFPQLDMWVRLPDPLNVSVSQAVGAMLQENLGISVNVSNKDQQSFMDALTAKPTGVLFGYVSYGMDFLDPFNMLSVWLSGGRHSWSNSKFDDLVKKAASFTGDPAERTKMFQDAEKILVEDVPTVFIYHETPVQFAKPWVKGAVLQPDKNGIKALHWPGYTAMDTVPAELYIGKDAPKGRENS
ncbi:MAG TPA: peptide ABC transporter substrate-binding protein, partial [Thermomicrobiales bacterium]|nr:peptide ABC transporter substrate-binding protein [Thermomicrobiales bacterium]